MAADGWAPAQLTPATTDQVQRLTGPPPTVGGHHTNGQMTMIER